MSVLTDDMLHVHTNSDIEQLVAGSYFFDSIPAQFKEECHELADGFQNWSVF